MRRSEARIMVARLLCFATSTALFLGKPLHHASNAFSLDRFANS